MTSIIPMKTSWKYIGKTLRVFPGTIYSPSNFYVLKWEDTRKVDKYHNEIEKFLENQQETSAEQHIPLAGTSCAVNIARIWLRANILEVEAGFYTVTLVDIGGTASLEPERIKPLPPRLAKRPGKALHVHFLNLIPVDEYSWNPQTIPFLEGLLMAGPMKMHCSSFRPTPSPGSLAVSINNPANGNYLRTLLIERGYAQEGQTSAALLNAQLLHKTNLRNNYNSEETEL